MRAGTKFVCYLSQIKPSSKISRPFKGIKVCKLYIYIYTQLSSDRLIKPGEFPLTEWLSRLCDYPVHDLDPVILVGMIVVLQGLELALHYFFCSKLKDRTVFF
jgi:hypothetical protein